MESIVRDDDKNNLSRFEGKSQLPGNVDKRRNSLARQKKQLAAAIEEKKVLRNRAYWAKMELVQAQSERAVRDRLEHLRAKKEAHFQKMYHEVLDTKEYTRHVDEMLDFHDQMEERKKQQRYQEWHDKVFSKIQAKIANEMSSRDPEEFRRLLRLEYEKYLQATNEQDTIFLDIVIESAYNPFTVNNHTIQVALGELDDPTQSVITKFRKEQNMIPSANGPRSRSNANLASRGALEVGMWASGKIESTPHGYFSKLIGSAGKDSHPVPANAKSRVQLDHFTYPTDRAAVDAEFPKGKRTDFSHLKYHPSNKK